MGFSVVIATAILGLVIVSVFIGVFYTVNNYVDTVGEAMKTQMEYEGAKARTNVEIVNLSQQGSLSYIHVENTGSEILDPSKISLFINGVLVPEANYWEGGVGYLIETTQAGTFLRNESRYVINESTGDLVSPPLFVNQTIYGSDKINKDLVYTNTSPTYYFEPSDTIEIISDYTTLITGDKVKVSVEHGVYDSETF